MRVRVQRGFLLSGLGLAMLAAIVCVVLIAAGIFSYYWWSYGRMIDERLAGHVSQTNARIYTAPEHILTGEKITGAALAGDLQRAGYSEAKVSMAPGWYTLQSSSLEIQPGRDSYFQGHNGLRVEFTGGAISLIRSREDGSSLDDAELEPQMLSNLFDSAREKRRPVRFSEIPQVMVNALLSAEDKRFFEHPGFDIIRIGGAALADLRHDARAQGASTLTMQLARSFFFSTERSWQRKLAETMVALELEHRFTKTQIFELYANEIYLGNRGSFAIHGFGEGAQAYFNKDLHDVSLGDAAFLAGIIRAPNRYANADVHPDRAAEARDRVLNQMAENRFISLEQLREAKRVPLHFPPAGTEGNDAPYFVDMVKDHLLEHFSESDLLSQSLRVYSTLDPDLQRAAGQAVAIGMANVDMQLAHKYAVWKKQGMPAQAQVAMVVLDPHTGEIRAVIGGRDYGQSQLNRALAHRQPGSAFKPFVYAAAFENAIKGLDPVITPATTLEDEPTTFEFDGKDYTPNNYGEKFYGTVTVRDALTESLNVPTVKLAEMIGYNRVIQVAREAGLDNNIEATPAVALGAYEMTPVEVAGGYTVFANGGVRAEPMYIDRVVSASGSTLEQSAVKTRAALDPRVVYQVTSILEDVINRGTGTTVRARGFAGPAAGKTGTSRDGWFAGYTSNLLAIVWVGFDDNRELGLTGASSAAPIWAEFMKRATALPAYRDIKPFEAPAGVSVVQIDPETLQLATAACPTHRSEVYLDGTEPPPCEKHGRLVTDSAPGAWLSRVFGGGKDQDQSAENAAPAAPSDGADQSAPVRKPRRPAAKPKPAPVPDDSDQPKKGLLQRIFGVFGKDKNDSN